MATIPDAGSSDEIPGRVSVRLLPYNAPLADVDAVMPAHRRFLDEHLAGSELGPAQP